METEKEKRTPQERWERATIADNFIFCKVMSTNPDLCRHLLELLLGIEIERIELVTAERTAEIDFGSKGVRFDVYVRDGTGRCFDLEMQTVTRRDLAKRARYYQGVMDIDSLERGGLYTHLKENYVIFLCMDDVFGLGLPVYTFENVCAESPGTRLGDGTHKVFFNAREYDRMPGKELREFFRYVYESAPPGSEFVSDIDSRVRLAKSDADSRRYIMTWEQELALAREDIAEEERLKAEAAVKEAERKTRIETEQKTARETRIETGKRFLAMGLSLEQVAQGTGLSVGQVMELRNNANPEHP